MADAAHFRGDVVYVARRLFVADVAALLSAIVDGSALFLSMA
jgi:hypothetical protein